MRPSPRLLNALSHAADGARARTTGFIGLGRMGYEMAYNLFSRTLVESGGAARFVVCDAREQSATEFVNNFHTHFPGAKIEVMTSPADVVRASQTVLSMLPSSPEVKQTYTTGDGGILSGLRSLPSDDVSSTFCIDSTTLDVKAAKEVSASIHEAGASMVDAPVSGGTAGAKAGTLSFLVGGTEDEFRRVEPILAHMGKRIIHCGPSGSGLAAKICNNMILGVQQIVVAEAMLMGTKFGLDPAVLAGVINSSTGACWSSSVNNPVPGALPDKEPPCTRDYEGGFATRLMEKDLGLALGLVEEVDGVATMGAVAYEIYARVMEAWPQLATKDFSSVYAAFATLAEEEAKKKREAAA
ncbi:3-hydroxyisobutyrate dehydrogenase [Phanerochaete sordida]|uniref:3-hydroxyisobutyrate dehydrogenase n=1 Tax=Phanerochaete sordida TaxID=48140 RepID=A0A9P3G318_9APHY|nr:3-hydroxyisobutyrate dehydrogenase [Phanerochaete sordida]